MKTKILNTIKCIFIISLLVCAVSCDKRNTTAPTLQTSEDSGVRSNPAELLVMPESILKSALVKEDGQPTVEAFIHKNGSGAVFTVKGKDGVNLIHKGGTTPAYPLIDFVTISPDGSHVAYVVPENGKVRLVLDGLLGPYFDLISSPLFTSDSRHIIYKAKIGEIWHLVIDGKPSDSGKYLIDGDPFLASDGASVIVVEKQDKSSAFTIAEYGLDFQKKILFGISAQSIIFTPSGKRFAAIIPMDNNKFKLEYRELSTGKMIATGKAWDEITQVNFDSAENHIAYGARDGKDRYIVFDNRTELVTKGEIIELPVINVADNTVSLVLYNKLVNLYVAFSPNKQEIPVYEEINELQLSPDGSRRFFVAMENKKYFLVVNGNKSPQFDKVVSPRMTPDGKFIVYRARQDGKRFLVIADGEGRTIRNLPAFDMVFEPQFTKDGRSVGYGVKEGNKLLWKVEKLSL